MPDEGAERGPGPERTQDAAAASARERAGLSEEEMRDLRRKYAEIGRALGVE